MKKILSLILIMALTVSMAGCALTGEKVVKPAEGKVTAESTAKPKTAPTPTPTPTPAPQNRNLLTGEATLTEEACGKRPIAVMVNNATANLPQYGISDADLIFEIPVEGDTTRLMAMYGDYTKVPDICSIRSCRYYFPILAKAFDAMYIHWGMDPTVAADTLAELYDDNIDGNYGSYDLFDRDQERLNEGYDLEHTSVLYGTRLPTAIRENNLRIDLKENNRNSAFLFNNTPVPAGEESCERFQVNFGITSGYGYWSNFSFDAKAKAYQKTHNDDPHMDGRTGKQLAFTNVIILETNIGYLPDDDSGRREIDVTADHKTGYYISDGAKEKITWSKEDAYDNLHFYDGAGEPLKINTGRTYIAVCDEGGFVQE
ncbi:MAG: DUF3048 domain-containing protein [Oscillospiraceae bacterium]